MNLSIEKTAPSANHGCTLVVMAKAPKPGMVKTRLTRSLSVEAATELYRCLLDDTIALARSLSGVNVSILCPAPDREDLVQLVCGEVDVVAQKGDGLAAGLTSVFAHFTAPGAQRVVAFNSDSPHLPASILEGALKRSPITMWSPGQHTTAATTSSAPRPRIRRFSMATAWAQKARLMACSHALADCNFPWASRIPSTTWT